MASVFTAIRNFFTSPAASSEQMAEAKSLVENLISGNKIAVFSKSYCPHCSRAKELVKSLNQQAGIIELNSLEIGSSIQSYLAERAGLSRVTVPQVYILGKLIGGNSEFQALHASGKLAALLK